MSSLGEVAAPESERRVMLVTGASSGIGEATARLAADAGLRVVLAARGVDRLASLAAQLGGPSRALAVRCDIASYDDCEAAVRQTIDHFGRLDVLVANAGIGNSGSGWLGESPAAWQTQVDVNVLGPAYTTRAAIPSLRETAGQIVIVGSLAGRRVHAGSMYSCTKHAVSAMGETLRLELNGSGVRVCVVNPGLTDTHLLTASGVEAPTWAMRPDDVARAIMFATSQPAHVDVNEIVLRGTGQEI